jgi:hypothetical protein
MPERDQQKGLHRRRHLRHPRPERYTQERNKTAHQSQGHSTIHISKAYSAGVLLGLLAWSSGTLILGMIGHVVMDIGLFAYWWTGIAGTFAARPITETGVDQPFLIACAVFAISPFIVLLAISKLRKKSPPTG